MHGPAPLLLDAVVLLEHGDELVDLLRRVEAPGDALPPRAPPRPRRQPRRGLLHAELPVPLEAGQPRHEGYDRDVHEPELRPAEERPVPELAVEVGEHLQELGARLRPRVAPELPQPRAELVDLVGVGGPEAGPRARVGVGGEEGLAGVDLVEVVEDDEGLADGAAVVEEHGDLLVDGVGAEEEVALGSQELLLGVLVGDALLRQRDAAALPERAHPEVQQHQALVLPLRHCCQRLGDLSISVSFSACVCGDEWSGWVMWICRVCEGAGSAL
jgi:hypothetical protein